jgi:tripartite ATP-independent transporter DctP family solute receptor
MKEATMSMGPDIEARRRWGRGGCQAAMRRFPALFAVAAAMMTSACAGAGGPLEIRFGHVGAPGSLFALSAEEFARVANERLGDRAQVVVFGSSQLGGDELLLQKLKLGTVELALPSSIMSSFVAEFGLFEMPYLVQDREHMRRIEQEIVWPELAPRAEAAGYEILAVWENGFRHVTNNVRPIVTPADLRGIKLRTPRGVWRVRMFQSFGANPTPMALSEVFVALQTGVMDGQENPFAQIHASRFQEVQDYLSLTGHVYTPAFVAAGTTRWSRLPEDVRAVLEQAARDTQAFVYETGARLDSELLDALREAGVQINEIDRASFLEASRDIYDEFGREVEGGRELAERARALAAPAGGG